jgi:antitoxin PrlF
VSFQAVDAFPVMQLCITMIRGGIERVMTTLTITERGQVTFRKDVLQHLGIQAGEKIELAKMPNGVIALRASRPTGSWDGFIGLLAGKTKKTLTIEEMNRAIEKGWAGQL